MAKLSEKYEAVVVFSLKNGEKAERREKNSTKTGKKR